MKIQKFFFFFIKFSVFFDKPLFCVKHKIYQTNLKKLHSSSHQGIFLSVLSKIDHWIAKLNKLFCSPEKNPEIPAYHAYAVSHVKKNAINFASKHVFLNAFFDIVEDNWKLIIEA